MYNQNFMFHYLTHFNFNENIVKWNRIYFFFLFVQMFRIASAIELNCTHSNNICLPCHMKNRTSKWPWSSESVLYAGAKHRIHIQAPKFTKWWLQYKHTTIVLLCVELYAQLSITQNSTLHKHSYAIHICIFTLTLTLAHIGSTQSNAKFWIKTRRSHKKILHYISVIVVESTVCGAIL